MSKQHLELIDPKEDLQSDHRARFHRWCRDHQRPADYHSIQAFRISRTWNQNTEYGTWTDDGIRELVNKDPTMIWAKASTHTWKGKTRVVGGITLTNVMRATGRSATSTMRALGMRGGS